MDADRLILATRSALSVDGALLDDAERASIETIINTLANTAAASTAAAAIEAATTALAEATEGFAAERMNHSIQKALSGRNVESL